MTKRRWAKRIAWALVVALLLPLPLTLALRLMQPPTTAVMLARAVQRLLDGERPVYPTRTVVSHDAVAPSLYRAVLASEDDRFYLHHGFDFTEIEKALADRRAGRRSRGASTLSQQVVKNIFLWEGRSWVRKGLEAYITLWLEVVVPKDRILDLYVNLAEWGDGVFGIEAAAQHHFRKSARALTRTESARLAAILPAPRRWPATGRVAGGRAATILPRMAYPAPRPPAPPRAKSGERRAQRAPHNSGLDFAPRPV
jgi:monofunctional glycosyltransferase